MGDSSLDTTFSKVRPPEVMILNSNRSLVVEINVDRPRRLKESNGFFVPVLLLGQDAQEFLERLRSELDALIQSPDP